MTTIDKKIENVIEDNMMQYSSYVLLDRAIPDLRDGLKPVYRRILYTMFLQRAYKLTKSANISGAVMKIHPHGDSYGTMVSMTQTDRHSHPFLIGKGNFGSYTSRDLAPAASRYSEVKLADIAIDMMQNFDKNLVDFIDNYDGTMKIPEVLPVKFPAILAYSQSGIGVGFSSSSISFNLNEICDAVINYINTGNHTTLVPDFPTGGFIADDKEVFERIASEGFGTVRIRGRASIEGNEISITEIPYSTTREAIIEKVVSLARSGHLKEVTDIKDLTGLKGMLIHVQARRGTDMNMLLEKLYRLTPLQSTYSLNMNMLIDDLPKVLGTNQVIERWLEWRRSAIERGIVYDTKRMIDRLHLLRGLEKVLVDIDKAIEIIRRSKEEAIETNLSNHFGIDYEQAKEVANMKLRNINSEYIIKKIKDISSLESQVDEYKKIVGDKDKLNLIVIKGLQDTKDKYGKARRTEVTAFTSAPIIINLPQQQDYPVYVHLTRDGYAYKFNRPDVEPALKPGDEVIQTFNAMNNDSLLIFAPDSVCHKITFSRIEETKINNLGTYLQGVLRLDELEIVNYALYNDKIKSYVIVYENNKVVKLNPALYSINRRIIKNAYNPRQGKIINLFTLEQESTIEYQTSSVTIDIETDKMTLMSNRLAQGAYSTRKGTGVSAKLK